MPVALACPECRQALFVDEGADPVRCSHCGHSFPRPDAAAGPTLWTPDAAPADAAAPTPRPRAIESGNPYQTPVEESGRYANWAGRRDGLLADRFTRWLGALIDNLFVAAIGCGLIYFTGGWSNPDPDHQLRMIYLVYGLLFLAVLIQSVLIGRYSQSVGKLLLGTKIVNSYDEETPGFFRAVVLRYWLLFPLSLIPFFTFGNAVFIFGEEKRCLHDYFAATRVIRIR